MLTEDAVHGMSEKSLIAHVVLTVSSPNNVSEPESEVEQEQGSDSGPTEAGVRRVCFYMVIVSALLIALMLVISHYEQSSAANGVNNSQSVAGWVAVVGAAIIFGSTGVPMKSPALAKLQVDSFVFALYTSVGIFLVSVPLIVYLLAVEEFEFKPWAILGAADIVIIGYLAFLAVRMLGYFKAPAIWAGVGMTSAFLWGAIAFNEPIKNVPMAVSAIILLVIGDHNIDTSKCCVSLYVALQTIITFFFFFMYHLIGVYAVSTSQAGNTEKEDSDNKTEAENKDEKEAERELNSEYDTERGGETSMNTIHVNPMATVTSQNIKHVTNVEKMNKFDAGNNESQNRYVYPDKEESKEHSSPIEAEEHSSDMNSIQVIYGSNDTRKFSLNYFRNFLKEFSGYFLCFSVGILDGTLLVPFKLSNSRNNGDNGILEVFRYIASFGISSIIVSPILFFFYCFFLNNRKVPLFHFSVARLPGLSSGMLWASANFLSVHATYYLGIKIGFPLTQTCVLIAAIWGIAYFKEFDIRKSGYMLRFSLGILVILTGSYLLGASG